MRRFRNSEESRSRGSDAFMGTGENVAGGDGDC